VTKAERGLVALVGGVAEEGDLAAQQLPLADQHHHAARLGAVAGEADHVAVAAADVHHALPPLQRVELGDGVAQLGGALEVHLRRGGLHVALQPGGHEARVAAEHLEDLVDHPPVVVLRLEGDARGQAAADVVVQAGARGGLARQVVVAGAHGVEPLHQLQRLPHAAHVGVRPEVPAPVLHQPPRDPHAGKVLVDGDLDVWIGLVVLEGDVEAGAVLLDQVVLEDQRLGLGAHHDGVHVGHPPHQLLRLEPVLRPTGEVAAHPRAQRLGLAHVHDHPLRVPEQVHAGAGGKGAELGFERRVRRHRVRRRHIQGIGRG
jgi:hypothetical protein